MIVCFNTIHLTMLKLKLYVNITITANPELL